MSSPDLVMQRLEALKQWQEQEQEKLMQQQVAKRKLLISEQIRAYEALGFSVSLDNSSVQLSNSEYNLHNASGDSETKDKDCDDVTMDGVSKLDDSFNDNDGASVSETQSSPLKFLKHPNTYNSEKTSQLSESSSLHFENGEDNIKSKRPFLRRGAGLLRYRMNLNDCKLDNLPKYKFSKSKVNTIEKKTVKNNTKKSLFVNTSKNSSKKLSKVESNLSNKETVEETLKSKTKSQESWANTLAKGDDNKNLDDSIQNLKDNTQLDAIELKLFELLEQKASNSSFCSTSSVVTKFLGKKFRNDSSDGDDTKKTENDNIHKLKVRFDEQVKIQSDSDTSDTDLVSYDDISSLTSSCMSTPNIKGLNYSDSDNSTLQSDTIIENAKSALRHTNFNMSDKITSIQEEPNLSDQLENKQLTQQTSLLKQRLEELENEIDVFRQQNAALTRNKEEFELEKMSFEKQRQKYEDDKLEFDNYIADEKQKLAEERKLFEKFILDVKKQPSRKDREEIHNLKDKIVELQTDIKSKDARFGAASARFRTQVKRLESEIENHQKTINELKNKNKKILLANNAYRRSANKRMLNEIQSNLPNLKSNVRPTRDLSDDNEDEMESKNHRGRYFSEDSSEEECQESPKKSTVVMVDKETMTENHIDRLSIDVYDYSSFKKVQDFRAKCMERGVKNALCHSSKENTEVQQRQPNNFRFSETVYSMHNNFSNAQKSTYSNQPNNFNFEQRVPETNSFVSNNDKQEIIHSDGRKEVWYSNGNVKKISADGKIIKLIYFNGDCKEIFQTTGTVKYFYANNRIWHTTFKDGLEVLEFPNGQIEKRYIDGSTEIQFPDGSIRITSSLDSSVLDEWKYPDGSTLINKKNGDKMLCMPNGQREIHTKDHRRREFPDGTIKIVYPDGSQETRYANGRVRIKDPSGCLVKDTLVS